MTTTSYRQEAIAFVPCFPLGPAFGPGPGPAALAADPAIAGVAAEYGATLEQVEPVGRPAA